MVLKRLKLSKDGSAEVTWMIEPDQFQLLLNYAIDTLLSKGLISILDIDEAEIEKITQESEEAARKEFLENLDHETLHKA